MSYTVGQAARAVGKSKSTISRAIDAGRISAAKNDDGSYLIDAAELHRVFPPIRVATVAEGPDDVSRDPARDGAATLELRVLQERLEGAQRELRMRDDQVRDLNSRLDEAHEEKMRLTALLAAPIAVPEGTAPASSPVAAQPIRRGFWPFRRDGG